MRDHPPPLPNSTFDPTQITRPDPRLLSYYLVSSLFIGPFMPLAFIPLFFRYHTLRYKFDETGVSMSCGILFRKEVHLTYRRIQDIHLTRGVIQRWMGLATVEIQTASGSASAEMSIEGVLQAEALRDYLYAKMRGARGDRDEPSPPRAETATAEAKMADRSPDDEALALLHEIRDLLQRAAARQENSR